MTVTMAQPANPANTSRLEADGGLDLVAQYRIAVGRQALAYAEWLHSDSAGGMTDDLYRRLAAARIEAESLAELLRAKLRAGGAA